MVPPLLQGGTFLFFLYHLRAENCRTAARDWCTWWTWSGEYVKSYWDAVAVDTIVVRKFSSSVHAALPFQRPYQNENQNGQNQKMVHLFMKVCAPHFTLHVFRVMFKKLLFYHCFRFQCFIYWNLFHIIINAYF